MALDKGLRKGTFRAMIAMNDIRANDSSEMAICLESAFIVVSSRGDYFFKERVNF
jgi:hypothetical protein